MEDCHECMVFALHMERFLTQLLTILLALDSEWKVFDYHGNVHEGAYDTMVPFYWRVWTYVRVLVSAPVTTAMYDSIAAISTIEASYRLL